MNATHIDAALLHYYRQFRDHQMKTNGGGAADGLHAYAAYMSARRHIAFRSDLSRIVADGNKRSAAAKKGWKTRRGEG